MSITDNGARPRGGAGGTFYQAFATPGSQTTSGYTGVYNWPVNTPLRQIRNATVSNNVNGTNHADDDYELLAKGLGAYNQGVSSFEGGQNNSWINALKSRGTPQSSRFTAIENTKFRQRTLSEKKCLGRQRR